MTDAAAVIRAGRTRLVVAAGLLMSTTVTWRRADYYSGGVDPVVAAKALLGVIAAVMAVRAARAAGTPRLLSLRAPLYLVAYGAVSLFGAWATGGLLVASAVLFARLCLLAFTVWYLVRAYAPGEVLQVFAGWLAAVTLVSAATGGTGGTLKTGYGRLIGGIPPLLPNEIAELSALCVILLLWRSLHARVRVWQALGAVVLLAAVWLSGSRTTLVFLLVAFVILVVGARRYSAGFIVTCLAAVPFVAYALFGTRAASSFLDRGGSSNITSLSQRTVAWSAALHLHHGFWEVVFGDGLARTSIPVVAQYRTQQVLDSTWISVLVQGGVLGTVVLGCWVLHTLVAAVRTRTELRSLYVSLVVFVTGLSFLESGLIAATPLFVTLLVVGYTGRPPVSVDAEPTRLQSIFRRGRLPDAPVRVALT